MTDSWDAELFVDAARLELWLAEQSGEFPELEKHRLNNWINYGKHEDGRLCVHYLKCPPCLKVARARILLVHRNLLELRTKAEREKHREQIQKQLKELYDHLGDWMPSDAEIDEMGREHERRSNAVDGRDNKG